MSRALAGALLAAILAVTAIAFGGAVHGGYTRWDDRFYVVENGTIDRLDGASVRAMFTSYVHGNYHPLTMLSYAADVAVFGKSADSFHRTNVLLHLIAVCLVFLLFRGLLANDFAAAAATLVFAVHPMRAEPVAWISGRKEILLSIFFVAGLLAWLRYARRPALPGYLAAFAAFLAALLSKAVAVVFPVALLAIDFLLERRDRRRVALEKLPMLALSVVFGIVAIRAQRAFSAIAEVDLYTPLQKIALSSYAFCFYVVRLLAPADLAAFYPYPMRPGGSMPLTVILAVPAAAALVIAGVLAWRRNRFVTAGIWFYAVTIALVLQLISVGGAIAADRYSYLPHLGLLLAIAGLVLASRSTVLMRATAAVAVIAGVAFAALAHERVTLWGDSEALWNDAATKYPDAAMSWNMLARARIDAGKMTEAAADLERALADDPNFYESLVDRGIMRGMKGDFAGSLRDLDHAVTADPKRADAYYNRALTEKALGRYQAALADLDRFDALRPNVDAMLARGDVYAAMGRLKEALAVYDRAIARDPANAQALTVRAALEQNLGDGAAAERDLGRAIQLQPSGDRYALRAAVRVRRGDRAGAADDAARAESMGTRLDPQTAAILGR